MNKILWLLDPGHGGTLAGEPQTRGKRSLAIAPDVGIYEGEFTRDIVSRIIWLSSYEGLNTAPVVAGATDYSLNTRIQTINWYNDEYANCRTLSIHANADGYGPWTKARGTVIWYRRKDSLQLARQMRLSLRSHVSDMISDRRGIKQGAMKILWPKVPGIIIECGFMTNKKDAALLASDDYRTRVARGIVSGMLVIEGGTP